MPEHADILRLCRSPDVGRRGRRRLNLPLAVVKVLISDLIESGYLAVQLPGAGTGTAQPDASFLQAVLDGIRQL